MEFKEIHTERLIIRRFRKNDFPALYSYLSNENVVKYEPYEPYTMEQAKRETEYRCNSEDFYAVALGSNDRLIGNLYLSRRETGCMELGFVFGLEWQGKGYATESARALLDYAFRALGVHRIKAECSPANVSSWLLMERLGMRREGQFRKNTFYKRDKSGNPLWQDTYQYAILESDWLGENLGDCKSKKEESTRSAK